MSFSDYLENAILNAIFNNVALQKGTRYFQLHTGDPGEAGTLNVASNNTRKSITGGAASSGRFTLANDLAWGSVPTAETYTHGSVWDASTAGNCLMTGVLDSPQAVDVGDNFTIPSGSFVWIAD